METLTESLFYHIVAVLHAPNYAKEHASALRQNFPRVPLPDTAELLQSSAVLGKRIAELLDTEQPTTEIGGLPFTKIGVISRAGGGNIQIETGELEVNANWGYRVKSNVQPGKGKTTKRDYSSEELAALLDAAERLNVSSEELKTVLGEKTFDVYLNQVAYWRNVPERVWEYTIGGYQVVKKWLSYREKELLGRSLTADETREVSMIVRRITAILLLSNDLNRNYAACKSAAFDWRKEE